LSKLDQFANTDTGELVYALTPIKRKHIKEAYIMAFQEGLANVAKMDTLGGQELRLLIYLMSVLDFENYLRVSQVEVAKTLDMKQQAISRALKRLVEADILIEGPKVGNAKTYRLDANLGYRGKASNLQKVRKDIQKAKDAGLSVIDGGLSE
jgi:DNA-binding transcriptional ArsR family regulator